MLAVIPRSGKDGPRRTITIGCHVREQFPAWPWASFGPLYGYHEDLPGDLPWASGTLALCKQAGIDHGVFVGTSIPYIWTFDLVLTLAWLPPRSVRGAIVSVKPLSSELYTGDIDPIARGPEKLEVERLYAQEIDFTYFVSDRTAFPGHLLGQLDRFRAAAMLPTNSKEVTARNRLLD
ncbi:TnsA endonuclease N-terminal domain-containing protein [Pseudorhodoferax sp. Leaf274]|uniref:TnsA endonuclease N-terminal domain-containing protein n=1 Tax=Pseudorhodoferax sp. Leaf274 TaxID=1736318 RepID=UPI0012E1CF95|nr:TnsA endonuclease N-terminal domain-containing protein [Pseudorhodoferax sp. Leaf274]